MAIKVKSTLGIRVEKKSYPAASGEFENLNPGMVVAYTANGVTRAEKTNAGGGTHVGYPTLVVLSKGGSGKVLEDLSSYSVVVLLGNSYVIEVDSGQCNSALTVGNLVSVSGGKFQNAGASDEAVGQCIATRTVGGTTYYDILIK